MLEADKLGLQTTWAREFCSALEVVAAGAHRDEALDVYLMAFGTDLDIGFMRGMTDQHLVRLRDAARSFLESSAIETGHMREAVAATVRHWRDGR